MMMIQYPEYGKCTANIACSVLKHFGIEPPNPTYTVFDELLAEREYKNIVVLLLDGLGTDIIGRHLDAEGFFRKNFVCSLSSTFPPTTVASTTAIISGLYPCQTAWLGWVGYFPDIDRNIVYFRNRDHDDKTVEFSEDVANKLLPYENIFDKLIKAGVRAHFVSPFTMEGIEDFGDTCKIVEKLCNAEGRKYVYAYCDEPDHTLHHEGSGCETADALIKSLEAHTRALAEKLSDTLLIVTADHGHKNIINKTITDFPEVCQCFLRMPSIEARAVNMFIKPEYTEAFPEIFRRNFGKEFILYTKAEVIERQLFGTETPHPKFRAMLGDFLAVGVGDTALYTYKQDFKSDHAGMTPEEMTIPFIAVKR